MIRLGPDTDAGEEIMSPHSALGRLREERMRREAGGAATREFPRRARPVRAPAPPTVAPSRARPSANWGIVSTGGLRAPRTGDCWVGGYAATWNAYVRPRGRAGDGATMIKVIDPAAFDRSLRAAPDVMLRVNHDGRVLADIDSGTLTLSADVCGLRFDALIPSDDWEVADLLAGIRSGRVEHMSFAATDGQGAWSNGGASLTVSDYELDRGHIAIVTPPHRPANPATSVKIVEVYR